MMTWNFYKLCLDSIAALAGVPSASRSNFLSRNSKLHQVLPRTYSSTSRGCAKQLAHDAFECNLISAGRLRLQQVLPRTYSGTSGGRAKELGQRCRVHKRPFTLLALNVQNTRGCNGFCLEPFPSRAGACKVARPAFFCDGALECTRFRLCPMPSMRRTSFLFQH